MAKRTLENELAALLAEQERLIARQGEIGAALEAETTPLSDLVNLAQEQTTNRTVLEAIGPRIVTVKAAIVRERKAAIDAQVLKLRPAERAQFEAVIEAAGELHAAIELWGEVCRELGRAGGSPLTRVPPSLAHALTPGPSGGAHWWQSSIEHIQQ